VQEFGFRIQGLGSGFSAQESRVQELGIRVLGLGVSVEN